MTRGKGRLFVLDHRDAEHLLRTVTPKTRPKTRTWRLLPRLDQGADPHCVEFAWQHCLLAGPVYRKAFPPGVIYAAAQRLDDIPGENYDGTTVRGAAEFLLKEAKVISAYRWAFSAEDALNAVGNRGPVVLGTDWKQGMGRPTTEGIIRFKGQNEGGHSYLLIGYDDRRALATIHNSWGRRWGLNGRALLPYEDLEEAIRAAGEACAPTEVAA